jgi:5'-nucleotidase
MVGLEASVMHILVTNDDGISAPGLLAIARALQSDHHLTIIAPDRNWSACGHVKTLDRPLRVKKTELADGTSALTTDGAPSDCVALALLGLIQEPIDLVVSGINPHANLGQDLTYSGTVMAAMEAAIFGIPGIALSLDNSDPQAQEADYTTAAHIASSLIGQLPFEQLPSDMLLNVNFPFLPHEEIRGIAITRQGTRIYRDALIPSADSGEDAEYWIGGEAPGGIPDPGTDFWALAQSFVSITPLSLEMTDKDSLAAYEQWDLRL